MTDELQKILTDRFVKFDRDSPDYPYLEKCYQALMVVNIPPEVDQFMVEWVEDAGDESNLLFLMLHYWRNHQDAYIYNAPVVAQQFVQAFYHDQRSIELIGRAENEYSDYIDSLRGKNFHMIIDAAHEIDMKKQIVDFLSSDCENCALNIEDLDVLMTVEHPLEQLYEACEGQDAMREMVEYSLDRVVEKQKKYLQAASDTENEDIQIFLARYLSGRAEIPIPNIRQMGEQLIEQVNQDYTAAAMGAVLPAVRAAQLHEALTVFREMGYTPVEMVALSSYDKPLTEVWDRMEQGHIPAVFALSCAVADRQAEMQQYIDRLDSLPAPLQKSVREYQERLTTVEIFCTPILQEQQDQNEESEER